MLEPRRLAARTAAGRMSEMLGEQVGETVGYRIRLEKKVTAATRIEVVTEGICKQLGLKFTLFHRKIKAIGGSNMVHKMHPTAVMGCPWII